MLELNNNNSYIFNIATLKELMEETKEVVESEMLALYLGINMKVIKKIQAECPLDIDKAKLRLYTYWLDNDSEASWNKLTAALENLDKCVLAKSISDKMKSEQLTHLYVQLFCCYFVYLYLIFVSKQDAELAVMLARMVGQ